MKKDVILLRYLSDLLLNGITSGVSKEDYNKLLDTIIETTNLSSFSLLKKEKISDDEFNNIIISANKLNKNMKPSVNDAIEISNINGKMVAVPTYSLVKHEQLLYMLDSVENMVIRDYANKRGENIKLSSYDIENVSSLDMDIASIVSSYYFNDIINRYVNNRIMLGNWPKQCRDIDEYIFNRDIAKIIDEPGTSKMFKIAYLQGIKVVCELLNSAKKNTMYDREIYLSNNDYNLLAFANYQKLVNPKRLSFLKQYKYYKYDAGNESRSISILDDMVFSGENTVIYSLPYYSKSNDLENQKMMQYENEDVKIMEKRIGIFQ